MNQLLTSEVSMAKHAELEKLREGLHLPQSCCEKPLLQRTGFQASDEPYKMDFAYGYHGSTRGEADVHPDPPAVTCPGSHHARSDHPSPPTFCGTGERSPWPFMQSTTWKSRSHLD